MKKDKPLLRLTEDDRIIVAPPENSEKVCSNLHEAILYLRRK